MSPIRIALWLFFSALAGALSGFAWMVPNGIMGMVLAVWLSLGTIWLNRGQLHTGTPPAWGRVLLTGLAVGLLGGLMALAVQELTPVRVVPPNSEFKVFLPQVRPSWAVIVGGVLYGLILHGAYRSRMTSEWPLARVLLFSILGAGIARSFLGPGNPYGADGWTVAIFGAIPFTILWCIVNRVFDPAWSLGSKRALQPPAYEPKPVRNAPQASV